MTVVLYTTHCPRCSVLEKKLLSKGVQYETVTDVKVMREKKFLSAPMLEVDGEVMDFAAANTWINSIG